MQHSSTAPLPHVDGWKDSHVSRIHAEPPLLIDLLDLAHFGVPGKHELPLAVLAFFRIIAPQRAADLAHSTVGRKHGRVGAQGWESGRSCSSGPSRPGRVLAPRPLTSAGGGGYRAIRVDVVESDPRELPRRHVCVGHFGASNQISRHHSPLAVMFVWLKGDGYHTMSVRTEAPAIRTIFALDLPALHKAVITGTAHIEIALQLGVLARGSRVSRAVIAYFFRQDWSEATITIG